MGFRRKREFVWILRYIFIFSSAHIWNIEAISKFWKKNYFLFPVWFEINSKFWWHNRRRFTRNHIFIFINDGFWKIGSEAKGRLFIHVISLSIRNWMKGNKSCLVKLLLIGVKIQQNFNISYEHNIHYENILEVLRWAHMHICRFKIVEMKYHQVGDEDNNSVKYKKIAIYIFACK